MSVIKIGVACHKPSVLPTNPLFVPIQVGSAIASTRLENLYHDDNGDNISSKNPNYCELTAQYWLWKNQDADYYGLCHYRRFLCFSDLNGLNIKKNERDQIEAYAIDDFNLKRFGLENENEMRSVIESNDVVAGMLQKCSNLYTPHGQKNTALDHWLAHDRALINKNDLEAMLSILEEVSPEIGRAARKYLNTNTFLGFNCFVMKRELFNEMCSIEFDVLNRLEKVVDLSHYHQQLTRIYGFMGEIISSSYIYYLESTGKYKVKHIPLVYFNYTDKLPYYKPLEKDNVIPVLFLQEHENELKFAVTWRSFLDQVESDYEYDVLIMFNSCTANQKDVFLKMADSHKNVHIRFIDSTHFESIMKDRTSDIAALTPFIPWIFPDYKKLLVFGFNLMFVNPVSELWNTELASSEYLAAPYHVLMQARCNDIYPETEENYLSKQVKSVFNYFNSDTMLLDLEKCRSLPLARIFKIRRNAANDLRNPVEMMNILYEGKCKYVDQKWSVWYSDSGYLKYQLPYAPYNIYKPLLAAQKKPAIITYLPDDPWFPNGEKVDILFWQFAEKTPLFTQCIAYMNMCSIRRMAKKDLLNKLFPKDSKARFVLAHLFPSGTPVYKFVKKVLSFFNL